nr:hypothetical protein [Nocardia jiangxiensis]
MIGSVEFGDRIGDQVAGAWGVVVVHDEHGLHDLGDMFCSVAGDLLTDDDVGVGE